MMNLPAPSFRHTLDTLSRVLPSAAPHLRPELVALRAELESASNRYTAAMIAADGAPPADEESAFARAQWFMDYAASLLPAGKRLAPGPVRWSPGPPRVFARAEHPGLVACAMRVPGSAGEAWRFVLSERWREGERTMRPVLIPPWDAQHLTREGVEAAADLAEVSADHVRAPFGMLSGASAFTTGSEGGGSEALLWRWRHLRAAVVAASGEAPRRAHDAIRRADDAVHVLASFRALDASEFPTTAARTARPRPARPAGDVEALGAELSRLMESAHDLVALASFPFER